MPPARPAGRACSPLAEALALLPGTRSPRLVASIARLGTGLPFAPVPAALAVFTGVRVSAETARRLTEMAGAALPVEAAVSPADAAVRDETVNYRTKRRPQLAYAASAPLAIRSVAVGSSAPPSSWSRRG